jgi:hypothetical protein
MLSGAVIAAQGAEIVFAERLDAGFGIDLGGREISLLRFDHAVSASAGALEWPHAPQIGIIIRSILILRSFDSMPARLEGCTRGVRKHIAVDREKSLSWCGLCRSRTESRSCPARGRATSAGAQLGPDDEPREWLRGALGLQAAWSTSAHRQTRTP